jgi:hypothetical protein
LAQNACVRVNVKLRAYRLLRTDADENGNQHTCQSVGVFENVPLTSEAPEQLGERRGKLGVGASNKSSDARISGRLGLNLDVCRASPDVAQLLEADIQELEQ